MLVEPRSRMIRMKSPWSALCVLPAVFCLVQRADFDNRGAAKSVPDFAAAGILESQSSVGSSQVLPPLQSPPFRKDSRQSEAREGERGKDGAIHGVKDVDWPETRLARKLVLHLPIFFQPFSPSESGTDPL